MLEGIWPTEDQTKSYTSMLGLQIPKPFMFSMYEMLGLALGILAYKQGHIPRTVAYSSKQLDLVAP